MLLELKNLEIDLKYAHRLRIEHMIISIQIFILTRYTPGASFSMQSKLLHSNNFYTKKIVECV